MLYFSKVEPWKIILAFIVNHGWREAGRHPFYYKMVIHFYKTGADRAIYNPEQSRRTGPAHKKDISSFDWAKLVEFTRQNYIALYSVLVKCSYELDGDDLTIYTNNKFYKNKLDDTKYSPLLNKCLQDIGVYGLDVHTISTTPPPKDSQAAAIAAIMGGGEEVSI